MTEKMQGIEEQSQQFQVDKETVGAQYVDKDQMMMRFKQAIDLVRAEEEWGSEARTRDHVAEHNLGVSLKSDDGAKTERKGKFKLLEQIREDPAATESEYSEFGTDSGWNERAMRRMTKSEQKALRLGATGSNSFTMEHANSRQLDSES